MFQNNTGAGKGPVDSAKDAISEVTKGMDGLNKAAGLLDTTVLNITSSLARMYIPTAVIEDTAQSIGSKYTFADGTVKSAGCIGDIGTTSFFPSKNLGCFLGHPPSRRFFSATGFSP